eukprot:scaffold235597_cov36-Cyclotella_meneghiniana.AAC.1
MLMRWPRMSPVAGRSAPWMQTCTKSYRWYSSMPLKLTPSAVFSTESVTSRPNCNTIPSVAPFFAPIAAWFCKFRRSA